MKLMYKSDFPELNLINRGKVRDIYDLGEFLLFVASDRISAFDVIMDTPIPDKGRILTEISKYWFENTRNIVDNHLITYDVKLYPPECHKYEDDLAGRSMLVKKCKPLPIEAVVRGYIAGSGWKEYKSHGTICGVRLPDGLQEFSKIPEPIFTPATKEETGHDENINFQRCSEILGSELAEKVRDIAISLYKFASDYLESKGIILADTKYEFGLTENDKLILIDEVMTPDSSRFWLKEKYQPGKPQYNFDKQILRDYLETLDWNKQPPPPELPEDVITKTMEKYNEAYNRIIG